MIYRRDIDGLRVIAVVPVILFHMGVSVFSGGYVGVDVFFVISGFLITSAIKIQIDENKFSVLSFYERRARRILPALFATIILTIVAGYFFFMPEEFRDLSASVVAVSLFASNFLFWQQIDYFNPTTELKPLIHTWSLAVEEQFYILFPLFLVGRAKAGYRQPVLWTSILTIISFILSIAILSAAPDADYYLLPTRAWELLIWSILALGGIRAIRTRLVAECAAATGLLAILGSATLLTENSSFPGYNALWPCLGAALLIHSNGTHRTLIGRLLSAQPLVFLGLISYSLYLVHWPLIVFVKYELMRPLYSLEIVGVFIATLILAALMWRFVEQPFRDRRHISRKAVLVGSGAGLVGLGIVGMAIFLAAGLPQRFPGLKRATVVNVPEEATDDGRACFLSLGTSRWAGDKCFLTRKNGPVVLLWGDSHINHYRHSIGAVGEQIGKTYLIYATSGCVPVLDRPISVRPRCHLNNAQVFDIIKRFNVQEVIMGGSWFYSFRTDGVSEQDISSTVKRIKSNGAKVKVIGAGPVFSFANPEYLAHRLRQRSDPNAQFYMVVRNENGFNDRLREVSDADAFFDPMASLCKNELGLVYDQGHILVTDNAHLSRFGADRVVKEMLPFLSQ